jgi:hypothetical protein
MQDLNDEIPSDAGIVLVGAHAINNKGQVIATATDPCAKESGLCPMDDCAPKYFFLLTPTTPP